MIMLGTLILSLALAEVTSWTIDLPEARKFLFEKNDRLEESRHAERHAERHPNGEQVFYSNRLHSNSKHHEPEHGPGHGPGHGHGNYAHEYTYHSYIEKESRPGGSGGSGGSGGAGGYLEGLRRSVELFSRRLQNCSANSDTNARYNVNATAFNATSLNPPLRAAPGAWRPASELEAPSPGSLRSNSTACREATRASEHVRRLAQLADKTAAELQDLAYSRKYMKEDPRELSLEENELVLKLAWLLDRLARYTGYRPRTLHHDDYSSSTTPAAPRPAANMLNASEETKLMMMNCLKQKSSTPATLRCAYPQQIPGVVQFLINNSNPVPGGIPSGSDRIERVASPLQQLPVTSEQELLIATDDRPLYVPYHHRTAVTHSLAEPEATLKRAKRAAEAPAITFLKYFVKHKVWEADNPTARDGDHPPSAHTDQLEVTNHVPYETQPQADHVSHGIRKRAADAKDLKLPEDPFQDLSKYVKNKKGVHFIKDQTQAQKMREFFDKIRSSERSANEHTLRIAKLFRSRRSHSYERDVDLPRGPEDLFQDISYYVKNKPGTSAVRDVTQAARLRAGLARVFLSPSIETVRRFGANYNPLVPDPLMFAALRSAADN